MKRLSCVLALVSLLFIGTAFTQTLTPYVITNDDNPAGNSASIFSIGSRGTLNFVTTIPTGATAEVGDTLPRAESVFSAARARTALISATLWARTMGARAMSHRST